MRTGGDTKYRDGCAVGAGSQEPANTTNTTNTVFQRARDETGRAGWDGDGVEGSETRVREKS